MHALITAGGTAEPIDDVRVITNSSTGRFGAALANALVERGVEVTLLASKSLMAHPDWVDSRVKRVSYLSFLDLQQALIEHTQTPPDLLFMAAAVSDFSPTKFEGKIRSDQEEITLTLRRNPKVLPTLRERCGPDCFLVGFKLLSNVSQQELIAVADRQRSKCALDLTVANDMATFKNNLHPLVLVQEGAHRHISGSKAQSAAFLADTVLARCLEEKPQPQRGASIALVHRERKEVLVGRRRSAPMMERLCFPGGKIDPADPSPLAAALREVRTEAYDLGQVPAELEGRVVAALELDVDLLPETFDALAERRLPVVGEHAAQRANADVARIEARATSSACS